ncbi:MAG: hypothetical protein CMH04_03860 [Marinovum sp.]|nr:hypothetical protein [Marinovum sp.]|tara:strand:- start:2942 stop:3292 length:351 start_codon:yes stop_codon:yes gene_type:complete
MNEKGNNIIPFPKPKVEQYDLETVHYVIENMVDDLEDLGYDVKDDQLKRDIAVLANMLFASFARKHMYNKHVFHFVLDESHYLITEAKKYARMIEGELNDEIEFDDEDPSNDNSRL